MFITRQHLFLLLVTWLSLLVITQAETPEDVIKEDVIKIENETQKVIRVSPLELPLKQDRTGNHMNSEVFQVQTLRPGAQGQRKRLYVDSKRMRHGRITNSGEASTSTIKYTPELKAFLKQKKLKQKQQKQLQFPPLESSDAPQPMASAIVPVQMTPGMYPIYYVVSKTNGRFGKFPIKSFRSPAEFAKYLIKSKAEPISRNQRFEVKGQALEKDSSFIYGRNR